MKWTKTHQRLAAEKGEKAKVFKDEADFNKAIDQFAAAINNKKSLVQLKVRDDKLFKESEEYGQNYNFTFEIGMFGVKDVYLDEDAYNKGEAYVHVNDQLYDDLKNMAVAIFGVEPGYNNTGSTGWIYGFGVKKEKK